jgi:dCMP deaminase
LNLNLKKRRRRRPKDMDDFERPSWDEYFMTIAELTSKRSNCLRRKVGCIIVGDNRILSLGYNGTPRGTLNCFEGGCLRCLELTRNNTGDEAGHKLDLCMCLHAEENAMLFVAKKELQGATMYVTLMPCISCVKKILQCGLEKVYYKEEYNEDVSRQSKALLERNGVVVEKLNLKK